MFELYMIVENKRNDMKVTSINDYIKRHPNSRSMFRGEGKCKEQMYDSTLSKYNQSATVTKGELQDKSVSKSVNKTADIKSSGFFNAKNAPSFKGAQYGRFLTSLAESKKAHKIFKFISDNSAVYEAATALIVAGMLRPATIMALPAKEHDKEKNKKAAAHSISSGLIGLVSTIILFQPIKTAVNKLIENPKKFGVDATQAIRKKSIEDGKQVEKLMGEFKSFWGYAPKILFAPLTAWATIALMPLIDKHILSKIFSPKVAQAEMTPIDVYKSTSFKSKIDKNNKTFQSFMGGKC